MANIPTYQIKDWDKLFENNRTRDLKRLDWVPVPNRMDGDGFRTLISRPRGTAIFGAWILILEVASKCEPRGVLQRAPGIPHTPETLARMTGSDPKIMREALQVLCEPEVEWLIGASNSASSDPPSWSAEPEAKRRAHQRMDRALKSASGVITPEGRMTSRPVTCQWCAKNPGTDAHGVTNIRAHHYLPYGHGANDITVLFVCRSCHGLFETGKYTTAMIVDRWTPQVTTHDPAGDCGSPPDIKRADACASVPFRSIPFSSVLEKEVREEKRVATTAPDRFQEFIGMFIAAGKAMNEIDIEAALKLWLNSEPPEHDDICGDVERKLRDGTWSDARHTPMPKRYLEGKEWTRKAIPRVLPTVGAKSRTQANHDKAAAEFIAEQARGAR